MSKIIEVKDAYCLLEEVFEAVHMAMNQDVRDSLAYLRYPLQDSQSS